MTGRKRSSSLSGFFAKFSGDGVVNGLRSLMHSLKKESDYLDAGTLNSLLEECACWELVEVANNMTVCIQFSTETLIVSEGDGTERVLATVPLHLVEAIKSEPKSKKLTFFWTSDEGDRVKKTYYAENPKGVVSSFFRIVDVRIQNEKDSRKNSPAISEE